MKDSKERGAKKPGYVQKKPCCYDCVESVLGKEKKSATVGRICGSRDCNSPVIMRVAWPARAVARSTAMTMMMTTANITSDPQISECIVTRCLDFIAGCTTGWVNYMQNCKKCCVIAKFHYTGPTRPARTFLRPGSPRNSVGSVRVSDKVHAGPVGPV